MSDTPRTDEHQHIPGAGIFCVVPADFSRRLERELNAATSALRALLEFYPESPTGADLDRRHWVPGYREAVEMAERVVGKTNTKASDAT